MAIVRKEHLQVHLAQLDKYYQELRDIATGSAPNPNICHKYNCETDQFQREFTDIDLIALDFAVGHFKVSVDGLKTIKALSKHR